MLGDGECNAECMNEACGWDKGDCWGRCLEPPPGWIQQSVCYAMQLGNGECDPECMVEQCDYDHGDCACEHVIADRHGFRSAGGPSAGGYGQYKSMARRCWLIQPAPPTPTSRLTGISLTFERFETEPRFVRPR